MPNMIFVPILVALWLASWVSMPDALAVHSATDVGNQPHKLISRALLLLIAAGWLMRNTNRAKNIFGHSKIPLLFVFYNVAILPLSADIFYSSYRIFEFALVTVTAALIVFRSKRQDNLRKDIVSFFGTFAISMAIITYLFIANPEIFGKVAGWDAQSQGYKYRLGGYVLRVDLIAALAGSSVVFWFLGAKVARWSTPVIAWGGLVISIVALALAYSRSALILTTIITFVYFLKSRAHLPYKLVLLYFSIFFIGSISIDQIVEFYSRGESIENLVTMSGRTYIRDSLLSINPWHAFVLGNGYLMNWPGGLYFPVPELGVYMASPHNGYLSVLLGSGLFGLVLIAVMNIQMWRWSNQSSRKGQSAKFNWIRPVQLFLGGITYFDYGVWGVTSPALLVFFVMYFLSLRAARDARNIIRIGRMESQHHVAASVPHITDAR